MVCIESQEVAAVSIRRHLPPEDGAVPKGGELICKGACEVGILIKCEAHLLTRGNLCRMAMRDLTVDLVDIVDLLVERPALAALARSSADLWRV